MKAAVTVMLALLLGACADPSIPPAPEANRNVTSAGVGVASVLSTCGDGYQRSTPGVGVGFTLTTCLHEPKPRPEPKQAMRPVQLPDDDVRFGIVSVGAGLAVTVSNCSGFRLTGVGIGMGVVAAPCPKAPMPAAR